MNSLEGPNEWTIIVDPYKEFPLKFREGAKLRIGAQIFNLTNTPAYAVPSAVVNSPSAGTISGEDNVRGMYSSLGGQRQIVLNAKIVF